MTVDAALDSCGRIDGNNLTSGAPSSQRMNLLQRKFLGRLAEVTTVAGRRARSCRWDRAVFRRGGSWPKSSVLLMCRTIDSSWLGSTSVNVNSVSGLIGTGPVTEAGASE